MTWLEFKTLVKELITVDANRLGTETYVDRMIVLGVEDLQRFIEFYRVGHVSVFEYDDTIEDGYASCITLPEGAFIENVFHVKAGNRTVSRPAYFYPYTNISDLRVGVVSIGAGGSNFRYSVDNQLRKLWIYPRLTYGYQIRVVWNGKKSSFSDSDIVPFDNASASLVALYVKAAVSLEVDRDVKIAAEYRNLHRADRSRLYIEIQERFRPKKRRSTATLVPGVDGACGTCGSTAACGCGCSTNPVVLSMVDSLGDSCSAGYCPVIEMPEIQWVMFGDSGDPSTISNTVAVATAVKAENPQFIIHLGDTNYPSGRGSGLQDNLLKHYSSFIEDNFYAAFGNHDLDTGYGRPLYSRLPQLQAYIGDDAFDSKQLWYEFVRGDVRFFVLNTGLSDDDQDAQFDTQVAWLQDALQSATEPWKIVVMHRGPYTSETLHSPGSILWRLNYKDWGASAVISAHSHDYERLEPAEDEIPYIVVGTGGAPLRGFNEDPDEDSQKRISNLFGYLRCTATATTLQFAFVDVNGTVNDQLVLVVIPDKQGSHVVVDNDPDTVYAGIAELREETNLVPDDIVYLEYISSAGDGGAGFFYYSADATAADDGGISVVKPDLIDESEPGRWIRAS